MKIITPNIDKKEVRKRLQLPKGLGKEKIGEIVQLAKNYLDNKYTWHRMASEVRDLLKPEHYVVRWSNGLIVVEEE